MTDPFKLYIHVVFLLPPLNPTLACPLTSLPIHLLTLHAKYQPLSCLSCPPSTFAQKTTR